MQRSIVVGVVALLAAVLTLGGCTVHRPQPNLVGQDIRLTIIHTADIHSRLFPYTFVPNTFDQGYGLSPEAADRTVPLMKQALAGMQPLQRAGLPDDIANAAAWLASDESSFVNGHALVVDGGLTGGRLWSEVLQRREALQAAMRNVA